MDVELVLDVLAGVADDDPLSELLLELVLSDEEVLLLLLVSGEEAAAVEEDLPRLSFL